jgi:hypothetical protein
MIDEGYELQCVVQILMSETFNNDSTQDIQTGGLVILSAQKSGIALCAVAFTSDVGRSFERSLDESIRRRSGGSIFQEVYPHEDQDEKLKNGDEAYLDTTKHIS